MDQTQIRHLLQAVAAGALTPEEASVRLGEMPFADFQVARHDLHRPLRNGFSEVILCEGKRTEHVLRIVSEADARKLNCFGTRASPELFAKLREVFPRCDCCEQGRTFELLHRPPEQLDGRLAILSAGTADTAVAEEAWRTARFFGVEASRHYDVGIAGLHRLLSEIGELRGADAAICCAGMEGALPSVVGGLIPVPIVAVPTSVGYGASFGGVAALLAMLNSCSEGITVVNIDNGFGAAAAALRILRRIGSAAEAAGRSAP